MIKKDIINTSVVNFAGLVIGFFQGVIIARHFGADGKGEIAFYLSLYSLIFSISNLGVKQSASYFLAENKVTYKGLRTLFYFSNIFGLLVLTSSFLIQELQFDSFYLILLFTLHFALFNTIFSSISLSKREITKINTLRLLSLFTVFILVFILFFILKKQDIELFFVIHLISHFICSIYVYKNILCKYQNVLFFKNKNNFKELKLILLKGITYCIPLFIYGINYKIDLLILPKYVTNYDIGVYSLGASFAEMIWLIPSVLSIVIFSYSISDNNSKEFSLKIWSNTKKIMLILLPLLIIFWIIIYYFIPILYGSEFNESSFITLILLPGTYLIIAFNTLNADMAGKGMPMKGVYVFSIGAIINILLNISLIPDYGIIGSAIASSISYTFSAIIYVKIYYNHLIKLK